MYNNIIFISVSLNKIIYFLRCLKLMHTVKKNPYFYNNMFDLIKKLQPIIIFSLKFVFVLNNKLIFIIIFLKLSHL